MGRQQWPNEIDGMETILEDGIKVEDLSTEQLLVSVLKELKKMNLQLSLITDNNITNAEVE